jgi:hypothetical protein
VSRIVPTGRYRTVAIASKVKSFSRCQRAALKRWLFRDQLSYARVQELFRGHFGASISVGTLSRFWHQHCIPTPPPKTSQPSVLLDVILQSRRPIRVRILKNDARLSFKAGRQRQRGLDKKAECVVGATKDTEGKL